MTGEQAVDDRCEDHVHRHIGIDVSTEVAPRDTSLPDRLHRGTAMHQEPFAQGFGDGGMVIILFDAAATTKDGQPYRNTYTWYFRMKSAKVVSAIAFFDTREFDEFWNRVSPVT